MRQEETESGCGMWTWSNKRGESKKKKNFVDFFNYYLFFFLVFFFQTNLRLKERE